MHPPLDVSDDELCRAYCEQTARLLSPVLKMPVEAKINIVENGNAWSIIYPDPDDMDFLILKINLLQDCWYIEQWDNRFEDLRWPGNNQDFPVRQRIFKIATALGQNECWHSWDEYTSNTKYEIGLDCEMTFNKWLELLPEIAQIWSEDLDTDDEDFLIENLIEEFDPDLCLKEQAQMPNGYGRFIIWSGVYHDTFNDLRNSK